MVRIILQYILRFIGSNFPLFSAYIRLNATSTYDMNGAADHTNLSKSLKLLNKSFLSPPQYRSRSSEVKTRPKSSPRNSPLLAEPHSAPPQYNTQYTLSSNIALASNTPSPRPRATSALSLLKGTNGFTSSHTHKQTTATNTAVSNQLSANGSSSGKQHRTHTAPESRFSSTTAKKGR